MRGELAVRSGAARDGVRMLGRKKNQRTGRAARALRHTRTYRHLGATTAEREITRRCRSSIDRDASSLAILSHLVDPKPKIK